MGVSKVTLNGDTLMDITSDTVDQSNLLTGFTAHGADGESVAGGYTPVTYDVATETEDGLMSSGDKVKLNGIDAGAEVNQNAFSNVKVGTTTIAADSKTDTLTLTAGSNITLTPNATSDSVTIAVNGMPTKVSDLTNDSGYTTNTGTVTSVATGAGLTGGTITGTGTIKADLKSETKLTNAAAAATETTGRIYPVALDRDGKLAVNVPWENTQTVTGVKGNSETSYRTGNVNITKANIGLGNVENKSSATIRGELTKSNVTTALGYTPYTQAEVDALVSSVFNYKGSKTTYAQVSALTDMKTGDVWQVTEDNSEYVYNGTSWEKLGPTIDLSGYLTSVSVAGQDLTPGSNTITVAQLKTALGLGSAAYAATASTVGNNSNLPTGAAVQSYVTGLGYTKNTGTVTKVSTGAGLTGGDVTTTGTIKADLKSETKSSLTAASKGSTANREYAVGLDANGDLSVNVPWENTQTITGVKGSSESTYRTGNVSISASNIGLGNVENKSSATIRGELTSQNVTDALGYTPGTGNGTVTKVIVGTGLSGGDITTEGTITLKGQNIYYATCPTAAATAAKIATTTNGDFELTTGAMVRVKFTNANTYNGTSTLNVDSKGAKNIVNVGTTAKARYHWLAGEVVDFVYDGTNFVMSNEGVASTTYYGVTKLSSATNSTSTELAATASAVKAAYDLAASKTDNTGTVTSVATGTGLTGGPITTTGTISLDISGVTAGSAGPTAAVTGNEGTTVAIPRITVDEYGRVTALTSYNLTNKNTTYSSQTAASGGTAESLVTTGEKYTWNNKASTVSPAFTGTPTAPTANAGTNTTQIATTAFVKTAVDNATAENLLTVTLNSSAWSSTTTTVNGMPYYTATASVSGLTKAYPTIYCGSTNALPSKAEKDAFNIISYAAADLTNKTITFYAKILPGIDLTINVLS